MRKFRKLILILIVIPAALYGAVKGYTWWTIKSQMEALQKNLAPVARLSWREIATPMLGPIGVKNIVVRPNIVNDPIHIGSVLIHANSPMERFDLISAHVRSQVPKKLALSINRVSLDLHGEIAKWLGAFQKGSVVGMPIDALGCGDRQFFSINDLRDMGYKELATDIRLDYTIDEASNALNLFVKLRTHDMMVFTVDATVPATEVPKKTESMTLAEPSLQALSVTLEDAGFNKIKNKFCSIASGLPLDQYIIAHLALVQQQALEHGFQLSDELLAAYQTYVSKPSTISLSINPLDASPLTALRLPDSKDALQALGLEVSLNGKAVQNLGKFKSAAERIAEMQAEQDAKKVPVINYKDTPLSDLVKYLDQQTLINTHDGKLHRGYLTAVGEDKLVITRQMVGGSAVITVATADIARIRVLR